MPGTEGSEMYDVAVVGGGPAGRIAALVLADKGLSVVLFAPAAIQTDGRTTALWQQSLDLLRNIGVWADLKASAAPLEKMRMIDATSRLIRAPEVTFDSSELGIETFGFNMLNSALNVILENTCANAINITCITEPASHVQFGSDYAYISTESGRTVKAQLAVAADGRRSLLRETAGIGVKRWSYPQEALVINLEHSVPHHSVSTEFHTPTGPFTLVPLSGNQSSLVCVETAEEAARMKALPAEDLERELEHRAHSILGQFKLVSDPQTFPLSGMTAKSLVGPRLVLIGETAHVFPPIGAQGLNLSMRDISDLAKVLSGAKQRQLGLGDTEILMSYEKKRFGDIRQRTKAVDMLNRSLLTDFLPVQVARSGGMYLAGKIGPFRRLLMREGMAPGSGLQPKA
ncbi:MAG: UbiH/UbiF family hydroxylase [Roseibium sp.]